MRRPGQGHPTVIVPRDSRKLSGPEAERRRYLAFAAAVGSLRALQELTEHTTTRDCA